MDSNNQENQANTPVEAQPPQPIFTSQSEFNPQVETQPQDNDDVQSKPKTKLSKKLAIIVISVLSVLLIIFIAVVIYVATFSVNYKDAYTKSNEVSDSWNSFSARHNEVSDSLNLEVSDFDKKLSEEKAAFDKFKSSYKKLEETSMLKDGEIKLKYDTYIKKVDVIVPKIEVYFDVEPSIYNFSQKVSKLGAKATLTDAEIDDLVSTLVSSKNAKLKDFGQNYASLAKKMYGTIAAYNKTHSTADYAALTLAKSEFNDLVGKMENLPGELGIVTSGDIDQMTSAWRDLSGVISAKYSNSKR